MLSGRCVDAVHRARQRVPRSSRAVQRSSAGESPGRIATTVSAPSPSGRAASDTTSGEPVTTSIRSTAVASCATSRRTTTSVIARPRSTVGSVTTAITSAGRRRRSKLTGPPSPPTPITARPAGGGPAGPRRSRSCPISIECSATVGGAAPTGTPSTSTGCRPASCTTPTRPSSTTSNAWCASTAGSPNRSAHVRARPTSQRPGSSEHDEPASGPAATWMTVGADMPGCG